MASITFTVHTGSGGEFVHELPAKMEVCDRCDGHGTHLTPSIGEHAYSREEFDEAFHDDDDRAEYFKRGGIYDVQCEECHGRNVVAVPDEDACTTPRLRRLLALYWHQIETEARERAEARHTYRMESGGWE